ncbi:ribonuclease HII [Zwartia sp.]|uniref:ribonuclease HII n=1 Tax=Zwartia sp. TaxID=2978004 RepID=UPI003BAE9C5B
MPKFSAQVSQVSLFDLKVEGDAYAAGVDEAGRGPLAGDVYAAAVILDAGYNIEGLADSKTLSEKKRVLLAEQIKAHALSWSIAVATVEEIDRLNILQATLLAMKRAVEGLSVQPALAWVDGNQSPRLSCRVQTVIKGDSLIPAISAASILAKTARDEDLQRLHLLYPQYAFDQHKGYGTALHMARLKQYGPSPVHRRSFAPVRACLESK